jgi:hypothetical protein
VNTRGIIINLKKIPIPCNNNDLISKVNIQLNSLINTNENLYGLIRISITKTILKILKI